MKVYTPTAKCTNGHVHVSAYEAERCSRNAPEVASSYVRVGTTSAR